MITLPAKLRRELGLSGDDLLIAETTPEGLLLRPAVALPVDIYTDERLAEFRAAGHTLVADGYVWEEARRTFSRTDRHASPTCTS